MAKILYADLVLDTLKDKVYLKTDANGKVIVGTGNFGALNLLTTGTLGAGATTLTGNLILGANTITTSNTGLITNLNADLLDGLHAADITTTPAGADTQVQFNDGGSFGGDANLTWDKTNDILSITGKLTIVDSSMSDEGLSILKGGFDAVGTTSAYGAGIRAANRETEAGDIVFGGWMAGQYDGTSAQTTTTYGLQGFAYDTSTGGNSRTTLPGFNAGLYGVRKIAGATGTVAWGANIVSRGTIAAGTITKQDEIAVVGMVKTGGTVTTQYGLHIYDLTAGATNIGIAVDGDNLPITLGAAGETDSYIQWDATGLDFYSSGGIYDFNAAANTDLTFNFRGTTSSGILKWMEDEDYFQFTDKVLLSDALYFTQTDGNEYIDSLADGYLDIGATTGIRLTSPLTRITGDLYVGNNADVDPAIVFDGDTNDGQISYDEDNDIFKSSSVIRTDTTLYRRYYHLAADAFDPGASGATWTPPSANTTGGFQLDAVGEVLYFDTDVHSDWDGASDLTVEIFFAVNVDNSGGGAGDTVDLKLVAYYNAVGDTACKTQTQEVATVVGASAQYKVFKSTHTLNYDEVDNVIEAGDKIGFALNLETDSSEVDDIIILHGEYYYNTTHIGIESGDI